MTYLVEGDEDEDDDMPIDPNEPTYCLCNRISFGTMVGCDNEDVGFLFTLIYKTIAHLHVNSLTNARTIPPII